MESSTGALQWWTNEGDISIPKSLPCALTIGNFDGVHTGHQELIEKVVKRAQALGGFSVVMTFDPHPIQVLYPEKKHVRLFDLQDQRQQMSRLGVQAVYVQKFTEEFSRFSAESFFREFVIEKFQPRYIAIGYDFKFGNSRAGGIDLVEKLGKAVGVEIEEVEAYSLDGQVVSTTAIRKFLETSDLKQVRKFLGRNYYLWGLVEKGEGRGRKLGFPTANLRSELEFLPGSGVYATRLWIEGKPFSSVTNIGINKTFVDGQSHPLKVEVHILNFSQDLYGKKVRLEFVEYLREEKKFSGVATLREQIILDCQRASEVLK